VSAHVGEFPTSVCALCEVRLAMVTSRNSRSSSGPARRAPRAGAQDQQALVAEFQLQVALEVAGEPMPSVLSPRSVVSSKKAIVFTAWARAARA